MKKTIFKLSFVLLLSVVGFTASAQYGTGIGVRFGDPSRGLTIIQYFNPQSRGAANFILSSQYSGYCITGLYEIHSKNHNIKIEIANVGFYLGLGGHVGRINERLYYAEDARDKNSIVAGVDFIAGVEMKLPQVPLLLSADIKPFYDATSVGKKQASYLDYALSLRFIF